MKIEVNKLQLVEGEEVLELGDKVMQALVAQKGKLKKSLFLKGIYNDYVVAKDRESGKLFRFDMKRDKDGGIELTNMSQVRSAGYVPMGKTKEEDDKDKKKTEKRDEVESVCVVEGTEVRVPMAAGDLVSLLKSIHGEPEEVELTEKAAQLWEGILS